MPSRRDASFDIIKGIAIVMMVIGHAGCDDRLRSFIYLFHMPVFFLVAGWFYRSVDGWKGFGRFVGGKVRRLWRPFVFWCSLFAVLHNVLLAAHFYPVAESFLYERWSWDFILRTLLQVSLLQGGYYLMVSPLWFLQVLFFVSVLYCLADFVLERMNLPVRSRRVILLAGTLVVLVVTKYLHIGKLIVLEVHLGGPVVSSAAVLVALGALLRAFGLPFERMRGRVALGLSVSLTFFLAFFSQLGTLEMYANEYPSIAFMLVSSLAGFVLLYSVAQLLGNLVGRVLAEIGRHTLPILILHVFVFRVIDLCVAHATGYPLDDVGVAIVAHRGFLWCTLYVVVGVGVPLLLNAAWHRISARLLP